MNLTFVCKEFEENDNKLIEEISNLMKLKINKEVKINRKDDVDNRYKADVFIILDKPNIDISQYFSKKNRSNNNIIILLSKITEKNVINSAKYSKNLCYIKNDIISICKRIYKVYLDGCEIFE